MRSWLKRVREVKALAAVRLFPRRTYTAKATTLTRVGMVLSSTEIHVWSLKALHRAASSPLRTSDTLFSSMASHAMHFTTSIELMRSLTSFVRSSVHSSEALKTFWLMPMRMLLAGVDTTITARPTRLATPSCWYSITIAMTIRIGAEMSPSRFWHTIFICSMSVVMRLIIFPLETELRLEGERKRVLRYTSDTSTARKRNPALMTSWNCWLSASVPAVVVSNMRKAYM
mmetsp:Transcript_7887/g.22526  ORF Transcript_7887/g.22526 Transcript_7887/m.22526 type:complete len:229 (+) Transcript_7887:3238-3924(+)